MTCIIGFILLLLFIINGNVTFFTNGKQLLEKAL